MWNLPAIWDMCVWWCYVILLIHCLSHMCHLIFFFLYFLYTWFYFVKLCIFHFGFLIIQSVFGNSIRFKYLPFANAQKFGYLNGKYTNEMHLDCFSTEHIFLFFGGDLCMRVRFTWRIYAKLTSVIIVIQIPSHFGMWNGTG